MISGAGRTSTIGKAVYRLKQKPVGNTRRNITNRKLRAKRRTPRISPRGF